MIALGFFGWVLVLIVGFVGLVVAALALGLASKPAAPKVPEHVVAGATIRIEDGGSPWLMRKAHKVQFQVKGYDDKGAQVYDWECKETSKWRADWVCPLAFLGMKVSFTATNECPVSKWDTKHGPATERIVEAAT